MGCLVTECTLVQEIAQEAEREDGHGEGIASSLGVAAKGAREELGAVFYRSLLDTRWERDREPISGVRTSSGNDAAVRVSYRLLGSGGGTSHVLRQALEKGISLPKGGIERNCTSRYYNSHLVREFGLAIQRSRTKTYRESSSC